MVTHVSVAGVRMWRIVMVFTVARMMFSSVLVSPQVQLVCMAANVVKILVVVFAYSLASISAAAMSIIASASALSIVAPRTGLLNHPHPLNRQIFTLLRPIAALPIVVGISIASWLSLLLRMMMVVAVVIVYDSWPTILIIRC